MSRVSSARALAAALTSAALLALPGPASASAAPAGSGGVPTSSVRSAAAARYDTSIRFLDFDHTRRWLSRTRITGQVVGFLPGGSGALKRKRVKLYRRVDGSRRWVYLDSDVTSSTAYPTFGFRVRSKGNATYKVVFAGNPKLRRASGTTRVLVYRAMPARLEDGTGNFHGRVAPKWAHKRIYLEKRSCANCGWHKVRSGTTGHRGRFRFYVQAPSHGRWWWRTSTPATTRFIWSYSSVYTTQLT